MNHETHGTHEKIQTGTDGKKKLCAICVLCGKKIDSV